MNYTELSLTITDVIDHCKTEARQTAAKARETAQS